MQVPVYDQPTVAPSELPGVRVQPTTDASGEAALGQGLQKLGSGLDQAGEAVAGAVKQHAARVQAAQQKAQALDATNGETELEKAASSAFYGTQAEDGSPDPIRVMVPGGQVAGQVASPQVGLLNMKGTDAMQASGPTLDALQRKRQEIAGRLSTPEAQQMFMQATEGRMLAYHQQIEIHAAKERQSALEDGAKARAEMGLRDIANNYADPGAIASTSAAVERSLRSLAPTSEAGEASVQAWREKVSSTVLNQFLADKDWHSAQSFFAVHKNELGEQRAQFEHSIGLMRSQAQNTDLAQKLVDGAMDPASQLTDLGKARSEFLDQVKDLPPDRQQEAQRIFDERAELADRRNRDVATKVSNRAYSGWLDGHSLSNVAPQDKTWLMANDPKFWHGLEQEDLQYRREQSTGRKTEITPEQDALGWTIRHDMLVDRPQAYLKLSPQQLEHDLVVKGVPRPIREKLQEDLFQLQKGKPARDDATPTWVTTDVIETGRQNGHFTAKGNPLEAGGQDGRVATAAEQAAMREMAKQKASGGKVDRAAIHNAISTEYLKAKVDSGGILGMDREVPLGEYEQNPDYRGKKLVHGGKVPDDAAAEIRRQSAAAGGPTDLSDDEVKERYEEVLRGSESRVAPPHLEVGLVPTPKLTATLAATRSKPKEPAQDQKQNDLTHPVLRALFDAAGTGSARLKF